MSKVAATKSDLFLKKNKKIKKGGPNLKSFRECSLRDFLVLNYYSSKMEMPFMSYAVNCNTRICIRCESGLSFCSVSMFFSVSPVHCSQNLQIRKNVNLTLKLGSTALFTSIKIILIQCFQFLVLYNERYPNKPDGIYGDGVGVLVELSQLVGSIFLKGGIIFKFCVIEMRN